MRTRWFLLVAVLIVLLSLLVIPAGAIEPDRTELIPATNYMTEQGFGGAAFFSAVQWQDSWDSYGDQLARNIEEPDVLDAAEWEGEFYDRIQAAALEAEETDSVLRNAVLGQLVLEKSEYEYWFSPDEETGIWPITYILVKAGYAFTYDHPEMFWIRTNIGASTSGYIDNSTNLYHITVTIQFVAQPMTDAQDEVSALQARLDAKCAEILAAVDGMNDYRKLAAINQWLAENNEYNTEASRYSSVAAYGDETPWSVVGSLLNGSPVCEGYAKAFQLLCQKSGILCITINGNAGGGHMWNAVKLDSEWYFCDPTWDDNGSTTGGRYFLTTMPSSHWPDTLYITPTIASSPYIPKEELTVNIVNGRIEGYETTTEEVEMVIALYDGHHRMIACGMCIEKHENGSATYTYYPPDFDTDDVKAAHSIVRFVLGDDYMPKGSSKELLR